MTRRPPDEDEDQAGPAVSPPATSPSRPPSAEPCGPKSTIEGDGATAPEPIQVAGYQITGLLGIGGFGTVWDAIRESDSQPVAIKTVHRDNPLACERLVREAHALKAIGPPWVPACYEEGSLPNGAPYFVCERLDMPSLSSYLGQPLALETFVSLVVPILQALAAVHEKGLLHRDLKPDNIFVTREPALAKLIDFGLTKTITDDSLPGMIAPTTMGMVLGTPLYMSPEQCEGRTDIDQRTDIYSLGVVFYEMLTGVPPFTGDPPEVRIAHIGQRPSPIARQVRVPRALDDLVSMCLAKAPDRRPPSVAVIEHMLRDAVIRPAFEPGAVDPDEPPLPTAESKHQRGASANEHTVALLYFETQESALDVQHVLAGQGGRLASVNGARCIAAFGVESRDNPIELALDAAEDLLEQGIALRVVVDRARARIHSSPDGTKRVISAALYRKERFPVDSDPSGLLLTLAVESAAAGVRTAEIPGRVDLRLLGGRGPDVDAERIEAPIGREPFTRALLSAAAAAFDDRQPSVFLVLGETGQGKSHLGAFAASELRRRTPKVQVMEIRVRGSRNRTGRRALTELARSAMAEVSSARLLSHAPGIRSAAASAEQGRDALRELVGDALSDELWPALAATLGWLSPEAPELRKLEAAPVALRTQTARAVGELLRHVARHTPVACFVDDAHLADETALDALEYATDASTGLPIWVCALATPSFTQARPNFGAHAARMRTRRLQRLDAHSAAELCRRLLHPAENIPQRIIARFVAETHHNPWLLTELATGIKRQNLIRRHARGESWYLALDELEALPELPRVEWLIERELDFLPEDLAAHAGLMAVLVSDISELEIEGVLLELEHGGMGSVFPLDAWVSTSRLIERGILVRDPDRGLGFRHEILRERVARNLPADLVRGVHDAAYRYYRDTDDVREERRLHLLAHHAAQCGHENSASAIYLHLADWERQRHNGLGAVALYTRAIEILTEDNQRMLMRAYGGRGLMHYQTSRFADALSDLRRARTIAEQLGDSRSRIEFLLDEAKVLDWTQDFHASQTLVERAGDLGEGFDTPLISARLELAQGRTWVRVGDPARARPLLEQALQHAEAQGQPGYETLVDALVLLGSALIAERTYQRAETILDRAVRACEEREDALHLAVALDQRRELGVWRGDRESALADVLRAQEIGHELGQIVIEYATGYHLAEVYGFVDDLPRALEVVRRAVEVEPTSAKVPRARLLQARLYLLAGEVNEARRIAGDIRSSQNAAKDNGDPDAVFGRQQALLFEAVLLATRRAGLPTWRKLLERTDIELITRVQILEQGALTRAQMNDRKRASGLLDEALALCADSAHLIAIGLRARRARYA